MPTSSIFANFTINDEKSAERFVNALEKAEKQHAWEPSEPVKPLLREPEAIRKLVGGKKKNYD